MGKQDYAGLVADLKNLCIDDGKGNWFYPDVGPKAATAITTLSAQVEVMRSVLNDLSLRDDTVGEAARSALAQRGKPATPRTSPPCPSADGSGTA